MLYLSLVSLRRGKLFYASDGPVHLKDPWGRKDRRLELNLEPRVLTQTDATWRIRAQQTSFLLFEQQCFNLETVNTELRW